MSEHITIAKVYTLRALSIEGVGLPMVDGIGEVTMTPDQESWRLMNERMQRRMQAHVDEARREFERLMTCPSGGNAHDRRKARRAFARSRIR